MGTTQNVSEDAPGCSQAEKLLTHFQQEGQQFLSRCRQAHTTTREEAEYATLFSKMLERLLSQLQWLIQHHKVEVIDAEAWLEQARPFLSQIDAGLVSDDESAVRWQLTRDGVTHLVQLYDELSGKLRSMSLYVFYGVNAIILAGLKFEKARRMSSSRSYSDTAVASRASRPVRPLQSYS